MKWSACFRCGIHLKGPGAKARGFYPHPVNEDLFTGPPVRAALGRFGPTLFCFIAIKILCNAEAGCSTYGYQAGRCRLGGCPEIQKTH